MSLQEYEARRVGLTAHMMQIAFDRALKEGPSLIVTKRPAELIEQYKAKAEAQGLELRELVTGVAVEIKCTRLCSTCAKPPGRPCTKGADPQPVHEEDDDA